MDLSDSVEKLKHHVWGDNSVKKKDMQSSIEVTDILTMKTKIHSQKVTDSLGNVAQKGQ